MARPTKYTPELAQQALEVLKAGNTRKAAAEYISIDQDTFTAWCKRYSDFSDAVKKAESDAEVRNVAIISQAAKKNWTAAAWWLERRRNKDWGNKISQEISGPGGAPLITEVIVNKHKRTEES